MSGSERRLTVTPRKSKKRVMSAAEHDAEFRATMKQIDATLKRMDEREKKVAPMIQELRKLVNE